MKKFTDYLTPKTEKEPEKLSLVEQAWQNAKQKIESQEPEKVVPIQEQIVYVNEQVEENPAEIISEEVIEEPTPIVETVAVQGEQGPQGPKGDRGEMGPMGLAGPMGPKGEKGDKGDIGEIGPRGPEGIQGPVGPQGEKGEKGDQGERGPQGTIGLQGVQGIQGERGDKGEQGLPGRDGVDGQNGLTGEKGEKGDVGPQGPIGLTGPQGERGEKGDKGDVGPQGEKGEKGDVGPQGPKGKDGVSPDIKPFAEKFNKLSLDINKKVGRIVGDMGALAGGGGSGSYWLNDLGDTDYSSIVNATDGQVLTYDTNTKKWKAADATGGVGGADTVARNKATSAYIQANSAFDQANTGTTVAQAAFNYANTLVSYSTDQWVRNQANSAYIKANAAFDYANTLTFTTDPSAGVYANSAFNKANSATNLAQAAYDYANTLTSGSSDQWARNQANAAFVQANTPSNTANSSSSYANSAFITANASFTFANTVNVYSYSAFAQANAAVNQATNALLRVIDANTLATSASSYANGAFIQANTPSHVANSASSYANSAFIKANAAFDYANTLTFTTDPSAGVYANAAFSKANSANVLAQAAFDQANTAPTVIDTDIVSYANHVLKNKRTKWENPILRDANNGTNPSAFGNGQCYIKFNLYDEIHTILNHAYNNALPIKLEIHAKSNATLTPYTVITSFLQVNPDEITGAYWSYNGTQSSYGDTYYELYAASVESFDNLPELGGYRIDWIFITVDTLTVNAITTITSTTANNNGFRFDANTGTLTFPDNTIQTTAFTGTDLSGKLQSAFDTANAATTISTSAYAFSNTVNNYSYSSYAKANTANLTAQASFDKANTISSNTVVTQGIDNAQNTNITIVGSYANSAFSVANSAFTSSNGTIVWNTANSAGVYANAAFALANSSFTSSNGTIAWNTANAASSYANSAYSLANTAITTSGGSITGRLNVAYTPASTIGTALTITAANTIGGTGYGDVLKVTNASGGTSNGSKTFRINNIGTLEVINSGYTGTLLGLSDVGQMSLGSASVTSNDPTTNWLSFNNNSLAIYDDGNPHIHSRANGASMWINTNNGAIILGNQGVFSGAAAASAIIMGNSTTTKAYVNIWGGKTYSIGSYGFLYTGGAGSSGSGTTGSFGLYVDQRVQASEFDATSDERAKDIHGTIPLEQAIKFVKNVDGIHYTWNKDAIEGADNNLKAGFGAQSVHKAGFEHMIDALPNEKMKEKVDEDGWVHPEGFQFTMGYNQAIPYHHEVIKHLLDRIQQLEDMVAKLTKE